MLLRQAAATLVFLALACPTARAQGETQLDGNPALFAVLAAINASGHDAERDSPTNHPLRNEIRQAILAKNPPSLSRLKAFIADQQRGGWNAELSRYIAFALSSGPPPDFKPKYGSDQMPPEAASLEPLRPLLVEFWAEAGLEKLWAASQPAYDEAIARYHEPVVNAVLSANMYLRNPTSGMSGRRFQVYIDLLGAPNQVHARSYLDDYYVVVTPSVRPRIDEIRHAYLHYLLDPLCIRYQVRLDEKKGLGDFSHASPILAEEYKNDFVLLAGMSLVKAVEARLDRQPQRAETAMREGFILAAYFYEALAGYEKQERALRFYLPEMIDAIDLGKEDRRIAKVEFSQKRSTRAVQPQAPPPPVQSEAEKLIEAAERAYSKRDLETAKPAFRRIVESRDSSRFHAKAYFGLARIAALERDPELAVELFEKTLESSPEPFEKAWASVYLARLSKAAGEFAEARRHYQTALAVEGGSEAARQAAEKELASLPPDKSP
ncbi:MAG TPA: tetratricopeptide repeat protein [Bryobacteraceae bacterium]|nr:tetratricopeptide repeat protein [Bryobacteraceae bacterium]HPT25269.1 tetratricopeptide repeat protein [Bryobacteraceae bacterium]